MEGAHQHDEAMSEFTEQSFDKTFILCTLQRIYSAFSCVFVEGAVVFEADDWHTAESMIDEIHEIDQNFATSQCLAQNFNYTASSQIKGVKPFCSR
jgi:hypothetical protein